MWRACSDEDMEYITYILVTRTAKIQWKLGGDDDDDVIRATFNFSNTLYDDYVFCSSCIYIHYIILYCTFSYIWIDLKHITDEWKIIWNEWIAKHQRERGKIGKTTIYRIHFSSIWQRNPKENDSFSYSYNIKFSLFSPLYVHSFSFFVFLNKICRWKVFSCFSFPLFSIRFSFRFPNSHHILIHFICGNMNVSVSVSVSVRCVYESMFQLLFFYAAERW